VTVIDTLLGIVRPTSFRRWLCELFAAFNLAFLALDITLAHSVNHFRSRWEYVPLLFSLVSPALLLPSIFGAQRVGRALGFVVGYASIGVGITGLLLHLESGFFAQQSIASLVYSAPFVAPLAYAGVGFVLLANRLESGMEWARWIVFLAAAAFAGNFGLSLADHAQNGFYQPAEFASVVAAAFGLAFLFMVVVYPKQRALLVATLGVLAGECAVGTLGFGFHVQADWHGVGRTFFERLVYGAPVFAPLLFANCALLGAIGVWEMMVDSGLAVGSRSG
jgi:hypothetical protein